MLFFKKKKLLEMDNKIDSLLLLIQRQQEQINSFSEGIMDLEKQQDEMTKLFDSLINKLETSLEKVQNNQDLINESLNILQKEPKRAIEEFVKKILSSYERENSLISDKIEKCTNSIKQDLERLIELENQQGEIKTQLEVKIEEIAKKYTFDVLEKSKEQYGLNQVVIKKTKEQVDECIADYNRSMIENMENSGQEFKQYVLEYLERNQNSNTEEIIKQFNSVVHSFDLLSRNAKNSQDQVNRTIYELRCFIQDSVKADMQKLLISNEEEKDLIIKTIEKNNESIAQDMESLDSGLRMLLLNSIMEQLPRE